MCIRRASGDGNIQTQKLKERRGVEGVRGSECLCRSLRLSAGWDDDGVFVHRSRSCGGMVQ